MINYIPLNFQYALIIFLILIPIVGLLLLGINILFSETNNYPEKNGRFECGLTSFDQSRSAFSINFVLIAVLFLPFDLEIASILPYALSINNINWYGLIFVLIFLTVLTLGFVYEIYNRAIQIEPKYKLLDDTQLN